MPPRAATNDRRELKTGSLEGTPLSDPLLTHPPLTGGYFRSAKRKRLTLLLEVLGSSSRETSNVRGVL
jgi:hypothetical protein